MSLDPELVRILADNRATALPFIGAGLAVDAGVPAVGQLARELVRAADLDDANVASFEGACDRIEEGKVPRGCVS